MSMKVYSRRAGFMGIASKPVEIEYLESTGAQYIDTGVLNSANIVIETTMSAQGMNCLNGSELAAPDRFKWGANGAGYVYYGYHTQNKAISAIASLNQKYTFHLERENQYLLNTQGDIVERSRDTLTRFSQFPIYLFHLMSNGSFVAQKGIMRIYSCKIWEDETIVRDFIPVHVGNVGYLYDKVSGKLFGNAGTGDFVLGPDK